MERIRAATGTPWGGRQPDPDSQEEWRAPPAVPRRHEGAPVVAGAPVLSSISSVAPVRISHDQYLASPRRRAPSVTWSQELRMRPRSVLPCAGATRRALTVNLPHSEQDSCAHHVILLFGGILGVCNTPSARVLSVYAAPFRLSIPVPCIGGHIKTRGSSRWAGTNGAHLLKLTHALSDRIAYPHTVEVSRCEKRTLVSAPSDANAESTRPCSAPRAGSR